MYATGVADVARDGVVGWLSRQLDLTEIREVRKFAEDEKKKNLHTRILGMV